MINELLRKRILGLTGDESMMPPERLEGDGASFGPGVLSNQDKAIAEQLGINPDTAQVVGDQQLQEQIEMAKRMMRDKAGKGAISNREMEIFESTMPRFPDGSPLPEGMVPGMKQTMEFRDYNQNGIEDRAENIYLPSDLVPQSSLPPKMNTPEAFFATPPEGGFQSNMPMGPRMQPMPMPMPNLPIGPSMQPMPMEMPNMSPEEQESMQRLMQRGQMQEQAPMRGIAQEIAAQGEGEDTQLAHLKPGEVVLPPEFFEDDRFEAMVESKFKEIGVNPEEAVVGTGIATLNPITGLEQFGFFKKIGKKLKKVVKKVAPIAAFIPGVGTALGGVLGGIGGLATKIPGIGGALGSIGSAVSSGIAGLGIPGISSIAGGTSGGFGGILSGLQNPLAGGMFGATGSTYAGGPAAGKGLANRFGLGSGTPSQVASSNLATNAQNALNSMTPTQLASMPPAQLQQLRQLAAGGGGGFLSNLTGGSGGGGGGFMSGLGNFAKTAGIGALAAGLGKLAYEDAKKQTGVPLTPLTTMSPTGRYNIEAEIARRMGQETPNPVEFGLLPANTFPELSGGKPAGMMYGGAVEDLTGGMASGMMYGGPVMAYAQGGAVQMQEGGEMDPSQFPRMDGDINGPGTETSDDIPAMLSDGEFVMTGQAVRGAGSYEMQSDPNGIISLMPTMDENRERGMDNMYAMMDTFASKAKES